MIEVDGVAKIYNLFIYFFCFLYFGCAASRPNLLQPSQARALALTDIERHEVYRAEKVYFDGRNARDANGQEFTMERLKAYYLSFGADEAASHLLNQDSHYGWGIIYLGSSAAAGYGAYAAATGIPSSANPERRLGAAIGCIIATALWSYFGIREVKGHNPNVEKSVAVFNTDLSASLDVQDPELRKSYGDFSPHDSRFVDHFAIFIMGIAAILGALAGAS